ncbi:MAG: DUF2786 domain-containing protein [Aeromicrobium sp.]|uniref:DUF2786 domain-containing protein n=1 Tax=Aeromicrobium sp. TaxID=1871063 RepID=UPI0039E4E792
MSSARANTAKVDKIRKLLALAENPAATTAEAEAFTAKAVALMAEYGIDEALLNSGEGREAGVADTILRFDSPFVRDKCLLAGVVALAMRCKPIILGVEPAMSVHVFGLPADVESVEMLMRSLLVQAAHEIGRAEIPKGEDLIAFKRSWWAGYGAAVDGRLREITAETLREAEERRNGGPSVELVLAGTSLAVMRAVDESYPRRGSVRKPKPSGPGAYSGYTSGHQADLGGLSPALE